MTSRDRIHPQEKQVAYFVSLHLNTVEVQQMHPFRKGHWLYKVEGKPRPMIVLRKFPGRERGRSWYLVLPITTKGLDERGKLREGHEPIGKCLDASRDSFVKLEPEKLPDNMLVHSIGEGAIVRMCDPIGFGHAIKMLERKGLRQGSSLDRG